MICPPCSRAAATRIVHWHAKCRGGTWCDCQHQAMPPEFFDDLDDGPAEDLLDALRQSQVEAADRLEGVDHLAVDIIERTEGAA